VSEKRSIDASAKNVIYNGNEIENGRGHVMCAPYWTNARLSREKNVVPPHFYTTHL
jgi:hypothetical protein